MQSSWKNMLLAFCAAATAATAGYPVAARASDVPANCTGCDLSGADFHNRDLRTVKWVGVDLSNADLSGSDLRGARLVGADLEHVKLAGARLDGAQLVGANLSDSQLTSISFAGARIVGADFNRSDLNRSSFAGDRLVGVDFRHAALRDANFAGTVLCYRGRYDGRIGCSDFGGADLRGANFHGALICDSNDRVVIRDHGDTITTNNGEDEGADDSHCRALDAATLRSEGHADLNGAQGI